MQKFLLRIEGRAPGRRALPKIAAVAAIATLALAGTADSAFVRIGHIVVRADGGFTPQKLQRRSYSPISFKGHIDINSTDSEPVPPLKEVRLDFDKDGRITTQGLPVCPPARIEGTTAKQARQRCAGALVGTGHAEAAVAVQGGAAAVVITSPLSLFNGPPENGLPTVVGHAHITFPKPETYVIRVPIERERGPFAYRVTIHVPEIAEGLASVLHVDGTVGRRYSSGGRERSFISARCSDGVLETRGRLVFGDPEETVIEGSVYRACVVPEGRQRHRSR